MVAGPWLAETLKALRSPQASGAVDPGDALQATLRPYQQVGVRWLYLLAQLGLGACLADDMGLGKTIQVLSLLLVLRTPGRRRARSRSLLVAPASLLANWAAEIERFAPSLKALIAHPSAMPAAELEGARRGAAGRCRPGDHQLRLAAARAAGSRTSRGGWRSSTKRRRSRIPAPSRRGGQAAEARARIALTGTPVENRLGDLWSIFDFVNPGLLGSAKAVHRLHQAPRGTAAPPTARCASWCGRTFCGA